MEFAALWVIIGFHDVGLTCMTVESAHEHIVQEQVVPYTVEDNFKWLSETMVIYPNYESCMTQLHGDVFHSAIKVK